MKRTFLFLAVAFVLAASAIYSFGNIARPRNTPAPAPGKVVLHTGLTIAPDADTRESTLQISEGTLRLIREQTANTSANASLTGRIAQSSTRTIMAGLFMFLAVSFAGVWLARANQRRSRKAIAAVVLVAALLGMATVIVRANAGLPGDYRWQNLPKNLTKGQSTEGGLDIEIVPGDGNMKLILPLKNPKKPGEE